MGLFSILQVVSEAVQLTIWGVRVESFYFITFMLHIPVPLFWLHCGRSLREQKDWALLATVTTASIALTDAVVPGVLRGASLANGVIGHLLDVDIRAGICGGRILAYACQAVVAPLILYASLQTHHPRGSADLYSRHSRRDLWFAFAMTTLVNGLLMAAVASSLQ